MPDALAMPGKRGAPAEQSASAAPATKQRAMAAVNRSPRTSTPARRGGFEPSAPDSSGRSASGGKSKGRGRLRAKSEAKVSPESKPKGKKSASVAEPSPVEEMEMEMDRILEERYPVEEQKGPLPFAGIAGRGG